MCGVKRIRCSSSSKALVKESKPHLTLYSRQYCHLCDDMLAELGILRGEYGGGFVVNVVDIDADPALQARYDELVPVLMAQASGDARELCHYFLDAEAVHGYLGEAGPVPLVARGQVGP